MFEAVLSGTICYNEVQIGKYGSAAPYRHPAFRTRSPRLTSQTNEIMKHFLPRASSEILPPLSTSKFSAGNGRARFRFYRVSLGWLALAAIPALVGCGANKTEKTGSIIGKTTQEIGEFNPQAGGKVSDSKVRVSDPILAGPQAYGPMVEQISKSHIAHALNLYQAEHGHYPKSHAEFMTEIIKKNKIGLPVLPGNMQYQYDVPNHKLVVIEAPAAKTGEAAAQ